MAISKLSLKIEFTRISADEMLHTMAFHLGLHYLPKYGCPSMQRLIARYLCLFFSQLVNDNANMLYQVVWCLATLCVDHAVSKDVRQTGGIPLLLSLLQ